MCIFDASLVFPLVFGRFFPSAFRGVGNFFVGCIEDQPGLVCLLPAGLFFDQFVSCGEIRTNHLLTGNWF
jgi:hypothetical protein